LPTLEAGALAVLESFVRVIEFMIFCLPRLTALSGCSRGADFSVMRFVAAVCVFAADGPRISF
jgi:hypothetical protein